MDKVINFIEPAFSPYFTNMWWLIGGIAVLALLVFWWAYRVITKIQTQREFGVFELQTAAKVWKKSKFVPEDMREKEAQFLYKEFTTAIEDSTVAFPVVIKNGEPRLMTKTEYDKIAKMHEKWAFSPILVLLSVAYGAMVYFANYQQQLATAIIAALVLPIIQLFLWFVIRAFRSRKNKFRKALFQELQEPSVDFIKMTKPFLIWHCFPDQFNFPGQDEELNKKVKFITVGGLPPDLMKEALYALQRQNLDKPAAPPQVVTVTIPDENPENLFINKPSETSILERTGSQTDVLKAALAEAEAEILLPKGEGQSKPAAVPQAEPVTKTPPPEPAPQNTASAAVPAAEVAEPAKPASQAFERLSAMAADQRQKRKDAEEFSVDSIGNALEQELAKRRKTS